MKGALTIVLFRLITSVVSEDAVESVSVLEGDSVTLKSGLTDMTTVVGTEWRFNGSRITFGDGHYLDDQTGDLKISNIRTTDSGLYKLKISSTKKSSVKEFNVKVLSANRVGILSVKEGDSLTLRTGLSDPQKIRNYEIWWRFGEQKNLIAEINARAKDPRQYDDPDGRFGNILKNNQTGDLTIPNIRTEHDGLYEVEINITSNRYAVQHTQSFTVTVSVPDTDRSSAAVAGIRVPVVLVAVAVGFLVGVILY